ncbi:hypothetical protein VNI00_009362 [Paramarasmius palmivorus]|uniref:Autophagy-related protein 11 n=1 Tax=Paramarasmius palmivorus TaxID=297713 RepID=A0AAW0CNP6_9AGAR
MQQEQQGGLLLRYTWGVRQPKRATSTPMDVCATRFVTVLREQPVSHIVTGLRPFHHLANDAAVAFAVWRGDRPSRPTNVEIQNELWSLINRCWEGEPGSRPNIVDVLRSLVDLDPSEASIPLAKGWDNALFTELRNNIERSDRQPQMLTDFLTTLEVKCKHIPEGPDMGALVESLPEDRPVATTPEDGHAPDEESKLDNDIRKLKKLCRKLMDLADGRLAFRNFVEGDIALFLQTRKPMGNWATFNVSSPHHFLQAPENVKEQLKAREWFVARITSITERVVVRDDPTSTNPYGLDNGTKYFLLQADLDWSKPTPELLRSREALKTGNWTRHELVKQGRMYREQARQKIEFNKFSEGDLALFLPTRNTITGAWAPFKISFFHIYLSPTGELAGQTRAREWILGYITSITERVVDSEDPTSNPFALIGNGLKYYTVDAKEWAKAGDHSQSRSKKQKPVQDIPPSPSSEEDDIVIVSPADYSDITELT